MLVRESGEAVFDLFVAHLVWVSAWMPYHCTNSPWTWLGEPAWT